MIFFLCENECLGKCLFGNMASGKCPWTISIALICFDVRASGSNMKNLCQKLNFMFCMFYFDIISSLNPGPHPLNPKFPSTSPPPFDDIFEKMSQAKIPSFPFEYTRLTAGSSRHFISLDTYIFKLSSCI